MQKYCLSCRGAEKKRGDLDLDEFRDEAGGKGRKPPERVGFAQFVVSESKVPYQLYVFTSEPVASTFCLVRAEGRPVKKDDPAPEVSVRVDGMELKRITFAFPEKWGTIN